MHILSAGLRPRGDVRCAAESVMHCLGKNPTQDEAKEMFSLLDRDGDGKADFDDFLWMLDTREREAKERETQMDANGMAQMIKLSDPLCKRVREYENSGKSPYRKNIATALKRILEGETDIERLRPGYPPWTEFEEFCVQGCLDMLEDTKIGFENLSSVRFFLNKSVDFDSSEEEEDEEEDEEEKLDENTINGKLMMLAEELIPSEQESTVRAKAVGKLNTLIAEFVKDCFERGGNGDLYNEATSFQLRAFGSYRLDLHLPGADMDMVMVVPKYVTLSDMFTYFYPSMVTRDDIINPTRLDANEISDLKVHDAFKTVIRFKMDGFKFNLAMARLEGLSQLPKDFDVCDDRYLKFISSGDDDSYSALNDVRVTGSLSHLSLSHLLASFSM